jgi:FKBP-type peptidyl-prolyl cis-trans isomerase
MYNAVRKELLMINTMTWAFVFSAALASAQTRTLKVLPPPADVAAAPADATKTASGLASRVITPGTGTAHPDKADLVTVHYTGWTTDGKMFDSSVSAGKEVTFPLDRVIAGWTEGVQHMVAGEKRRFWIPEALAYKGQAERPKGTLVFDVELIKFTESPTKAPADVKKAPADATRTSSGLAYKVLTPGTGTQHPKSSSMVTVNYSGWTTQGKLFDSSLLRGAPISFRLNEVIQGWTEGVQLMVEGEKTRFWIPERLAYKGQSEPYGDLVFDVELIKTN